MNLKPRITLQELYHGLVLMVGAIIMAAVVSIITYVFLSFVENANAADLLPLRAYDASRGVYAEALAQVHACYPGKAKLSPAAYEAHFTGEANEKFCALYIDATDTIFININRTNCSSPRESLLHELIHAYGYDHPQDESLLNTHDDEHFVELERCKRIQPEASEAFGYPKSRMVFEATSSDKFMKRLALGIDIFLLGPLDLGVRMGAFNTQNIRVLNGYHAFGQLELGYRIDLSSTYARVAQGIAMVGGRFLATSYQFPTSLELGLKAKGWHLGLLAIHYSNGGVGQNGKVYNGLGISLGRSL